MITAGRLAPFRAAQIAALAARRAANGNRRVGSDVFQYHAELRGPRPPNNSPDDKNDLSPATAHLPPSPASVLHWRFIVAILLAENALFPPLSLIRKKMHQRNLSRTVGQAQKRREKERESLVLGNLIFGKIPDWRSVRDGFLLSPLPPPPSGGWDDIG